MLRMMNSAGLTGAMPTTMLTMPRSMSSAVVVVLSQLTKKALPGELPVARAEDARAGFGEPVDLDARRSTAGPGRMLTGYRWAYVNKETSDEDS